MKKYNSIYFIGIGGISMSALAELMIEKGIKVFGSDRKQNHLIDKLIKNGATIYIGHKASNVENVDIVVYTAAISNDNEELIRARELKIPIMERSEFLGLIMKDYKYNICIAGAHGKTTTTSMISSIFLRSNLDPTILIGGEFDLINGNLKIGKSEYFIAESCEYKDSFLKFHPYAAIVSNIEAEHLDYFKDIDQILKSFKEFISLVPKEGVAIINYEDLNSKKIIEDISCNIITFGLKTGDIHADNIQFDELGHPSFDVIYNKSLYCKVSLQVGGIHNILNALSAIAASIFFNIEKSYFIEALNDFKLPNRRFQHIGTRDGIKVIDDYSHHPTEISSLIASMRNMNLNEIYMVFQPHTYTRTKALFNDFCKCFNGLKNLHLIITDIYAAREKDPLDINSKMLVDSIKNEGLDVIYIKDFKDIVEFVLKKAKKDDMLITVGAGDVNEIGNLFLSYSIDK